MPYKLFLDDVRTMTDCVAYMHSRIGRKNPIYLEKGWAICRNFECFKATILDMGIPDFISFDHDLADEHYLNFLQGKPNSYYTDPTGYDCAKWLVEYCHLKDLKIPDFAVHSMNPVGAERIFSYLTKAKQEVNDREGIQGIGD